MSRMRILKNMAQKLFKNIALGHAQKTQTKFWQKWKIYM